MRKAELQRRAGDDCLRALIAGITDYAIVMLDPNGCVASWNAGAKQLLGYHAEEVIGAPFAKFYPRTTSYMGSPRRYYGSSRRPAGTRKRGGSCGRMARASETTPS